MVLFRRTCRGRVVTGFVLGILIGFTAHAASAELLPRDVVERLAGTDERGVVVARFYAERDFHSAWSEDGRISEQGEALRHELAGAAREGLNPQVYEVAPPGAGVDSIAAFEVAMARSLLHYATELRLGRVDAEFADPTLSAMRSSFDPIELLRQVAQGDVAVVLGGLAPNNIPYIRLRDQLSRYRQIEAAGGWPQLPEVKKLERGMRDERVAIMRVRLDAAGDLTGSTSDAALFDGGVEAAVKQFQERHGLEPDGIVGSATRAAMNVSVAERLEQIALNMERWRWMPDTLGSDFILVDIPGFKLYLVQQGELAQTMRVVVGKAYHQTPVFSGLMTYLSVNPYWNVPNSIAVNELLPKIQADPTYLQSKGFELLEGWDEGSPIIDATRIDWTPIGPGSFPYRIRQRPGPQNALGRIKFMFPNEHSIYLHDTPSRQLFSRASRAFSHGCIRVERPMDLAVRLLGDGSGWTEEQLTNLLDAAEPTNINMPATMPVHLTYQTAWVDEAGLMQFYPDIYDRDAALTRAIADDAARGG